MNALKLFLQMHKGRTILMGYIIERHLSDLNQLRNL